jgi:hypothetical protein
VVAKALVGFVHELADGLDGLLEQAALREASFEHSAKGAPSNDRRYTVIRVGHWRSRSDVRVSPARGGGGWGGMHARVVHGGMHRVWF